MRYVVWFSCGAASAVAAKLAMEYYPYETEIVYCNTLASEHPDNKRFLMAVEGWIGKRIKIIESEKYNSIDEVFMHTKYMAGIAGARCTVEMKKIPRENFQDEKDIHIFGYTADEKARIARFEKQNPSLNVEWILRDCEITKNDCYRKLEVAGILLPKMYQLGFDHNNCIGCVKATSPAYWNKVRMHFPDDFKRRAKQCRLLGVKLVRLGGKRIYLDELPLTLGSEQLALSDGDIECGPMCQTVAEVE